MATQSVSSDVAAANEILTERSGASLSIRLNRPAKKNAMTSKMYLEMADLLGRADQDAGIRVVVVHGAGGAFTAGNDLEDFLNSPASTDSPQSRLMKALAAFGKPLIAAVHGVAVGGGTTMLGHFDFVYAAESTRFQAPFVNLGLVCEFGSSYWLPLRIGHLRASELILLGQPFDAAKALQLGLVTQVVPDSELMARAFETAKQLEQKPAAALLACKRLMK